MATPPTMVSIWRLAGVAESRRMKSTPLRGAMSSKETGPAGSAAVDLQKPAAAIEMAANASAGRAAQSFTTILLVSYQRHVKRTAFDSSIAFGFQLLVELRKEICADARLRP